MAKSFTANCSALSGCIAVWRCGRVVQSGRFEADELGQFPLDAMLVGERVLCGVSALKDEIGPYELGKMQAYLRALELPAGLAVNFGKRALQIRGVRPPRR